MGAGLQRWWSAGAYESACEAYDRKQRLKNFERSMFSWSFDQVAAGMTLDEMNRLFPHPRANEGFVLLCLEHGIYGRRDRGDECGPCRRRAEPFGLKPTTFEHLATSPLVKEGFAIAFDPRPMRIGSAELKDNRVWYGHPEFEWKGHRWIDSNFDDDRSIAEGLVAAMNAPPDPYMLRLAGRGFGKSTLMQQAAEAACERGERVLIMGQQGTIEVIADKRVGDERYLFTRDAVFKVEREANVEKLVVKSGEKKQMIEIDVDRVLEGDSVTIGGIRFVAQAPDEPHRLCGNCREDCTDRSVSVGWAPHGWFCSEQCSEEAKVKMQEHIEQHRTLAGKVDTVERAMAAGLLPTGSAAKKVYEALWASSSAKIGESFQLPVEFPVPEPKVSLHDLLERAWGIIANANGGDWDKANADWREAAARWRDEYHRHDLDEPVDIEMYPGTHWSARQVPNAHAVLFESRSGDSIVVPFEMIAKFFDHRAEAMGAPDSGRIGDQIRPCHCCGREQKVEHYRLCVESTMSIGPFGDAEDLYVCDACAPDVLKAVARVREGKAPARGEPHDIDLIADDARPGEG